MKYSRIQPYVFLVFVILGHAQTVYAIRYARDTKPVTPIAPSTPKTEAIPPAGTLPQLPTRSIPITNPLLAAQIDKTAAEDRTLTQQTRSKLQAQQKKDAQKIITSTLNDVTALKPTLPSDDQPIAQEIAQILTNNQNNETMQDIAQLAAYSSEIAQNTSSQAPPAQKVVPPLAIDELLRSTPALWKYATVNRNGKPQNYISTQRILPNDTVDITLKSPDTLPHVMNAMIANIESIAEQPASQAILLPAPSNIEQTSSAQLSIIPTAELSKQLVTIAPEAKPLLNLAAQALRIEGDFVNALTSTQPATTEPTTLVPLQPVDITTVQKASDALDTILTQPALQHVAPLFAQAPLVHALHEGVKQELSCLPYQQPIAAQAIAPIPNLSQATVAHLAQNTNLSPFFTVQRGPLHVPLSTAAQMPIQAQDQLRFAVGSPQKLSQVLNYVVPTLEQSTQVSGGIPALPAPGTISLPGGEISAQEMGKRFVKNMKTIQTFAQRVNQMAQSGGKFSKPDLDQVHTAINNNQEMLAQTASAIKTSDDAIIQAGLEGITQATQQTLNNIEGTPQTNIEAIAPEDQASFMNQAGAVLLGTTNNLLSGAPEQIQALYNQHFAANDATIAAQDQAELDAFTRTTESLLSVQDPAQLETNVSTVMNQTADTLQATSNNLVAQSVLAPTPLGAINVDQQIQRSFDKQTKKAQAAANALKKVPEPTIAKAAQRNAASLNRMTKAAQNAQSNLLRPGRIPTTQARQAAAETMGTILNIVKRVPK